MSGVILLVFIGIIAAYFFTRGRKKIGLPVSGKHWKTVIVGVVLVVIVMYAASSGH
jgi:hypothetical protein